MPSLKRLTSSRLARGFIPAFVLIILIQVQARAERLEAQICTNANSDDRYVEIQYPDSGYLPCRVFYMRAGDRREQVHSTQTQGVCEAVFQKIVVNLSNGGFTCQPMATPAAGEASASTPSDISNKGLLEATYGGTFKEKCRCVEIPIDEAAKSAGEFEGKTTDVNVTGQFQYEQDGSRWKLVIFHVSTALVHTSPGLFGMARLKWEGNGWNVVDFERFVGTMGQFGKMPDAKLVQVGDSNYGVMFEATIGAQGYDSYFLVLIAAFENGFKQIGKFDGGADNTRSGVKEFDEYRATYKFERHDGVLYDLYVTLSGTKNGQSFRSTDHYVYRDSEGQYKLNGSE